MEGDPMQLTIIIPTYNERENITILIETIENTLKDIKHQIIVIDDNSPDGTADVVEALITRYCNISVIRRPTKLGLASAILAGIEVSKGDVIVVMDADLQHPPELVLKMFEAIKVQDIVIASRYIMGGKIEGWSALRRVASRGAIKLAHLLLPQTRRVKDPVSGYFMFKRKILSDLQFEGVGYKFLTEMLVRCPEARVIEIPYTFRPRKAGKSKLDVKDYYRYAILCLKLAGYRPAKFALVGASGIAVNEGILHMLVSIGIPIFLASPIAIEASILNNFIWNDRWTFRDRREKKYMLRCLNFHGATLVGSIINYLILLILSGIGLSYLFSNLIGILLGFIMNYFLSEAYVW
jgi:dolichol-phosphate mannosyltransferase